MTGPRCNARTGIVAAICVLNHGSPLISRDHPRHPPHAPVQGISRAEPLASWLNSLRLKNICDQRLFPPLPETPSGGMTAATESEHDGGHRGGPFMDPTLITACQKFLVPCHLAHASRRGQMGSSRLARHESR